MCFALPFCLPGCSGERKQRYGEVFAISVLLPHLSSQTVTVILYNSISRVPDQVIRGSHGHRGRKMCMCVLLLVSVHAC